MREPNSKKERNMVEREGKCPALSSALRMHTPSYTKAHTDRQIHTMYTKVTVHWVRNKFMPEVVKSLSHLLPSKGNSGSFHSICVWGGIVYYFIPLAGDTQARL